MKKEFDKNLTTRRNTRVAGVHTGREKLSLYFTVSKYIDYYLT